MSLTQLRLHDSPEGDQPQSLAGAFYTLSSSPSKCLKKWFQAHRMENAPS